MDKYGYYVSYLYGKIREYVQPYMNYYNKDRKISDIYGGKIFVSDYATSCDYNVLKSNGITHIITCIIGISERYPNEFKYLKLDIPDTEDYDIWRHFKDTNEFINNALKDENNKVLIHCMYGISRSVTIACAYLVSISSNYDVREIIKMVKIIRPESNPNKGFIKQLEDYYISSNI